MDCALERWNMDFVVSKSIRYHAYRRSFWDSLSNLSKILTIVSGSAVLVSLVGEFKVWAVITAIIVAITSAADLVLGFSEKARTHDGLYRAFSRMAQDIALDEKPTPETISTWRRRRLEIEMDEPFIVDLLERRCSGEEARARGCDVRPAWVLTRRQIAFSQWWMLPATSKDDLPLVS